MMFLEFSGATNGAKNRQTLRLFSRFSSMIKNSKHDFQAADASCDHQSVSCPSRREFLVRATTTVGGLVLGLSVLGQRAVLAQDAAPAAPATAPETPAVPAAPAAPDADDVVLAISKDSPLNKVGGSQVVETKLGKVIIVRTGEATFAATSALCTHKGAVIGYDEETKQLLCPRHGARFALDGKVKKGPAATPLKEFKASGTAAQAVITIDAA
jgi:cytochrome b6-f complex iron-sulfur subunit